MVVLADKSDVAQRTQTEITHERVEYIRSNMDKPLDELQDETGLSEYVIKTIIEAKQNDFWQKQGETTSKYRWLTDEMKNYLLTVEFGSRRELRIKFNRRFRMSNLTPLSSPTLKKYHDKLQEEGPSKTHNKGETPR